MHELFRQMGGAGPDGQEDGGGGALGLATDWRVHTWLTISNFPGGASKKKPANA